MPYRFLDNIAIADVAFEATGKNREELFISAADALLNVMVDDPATVRLIERVEFGLEDKELDMLLFNFLNELVFFKDARQLLLRVSAVEFRRSGGLFLLSAEAGGERPDPARHPLVVDVKAVTLHRFRVEKMIHGWRAEVVLDI